MGRCRGLLVAVSVAAVCGAAPLTAAEAAVSPAVSVPTAAVPAAGSWGRAIAVPGLAALNTGKTAEVNSVACPSAGNCAVGGDFWDSRGQQGFVAAERNGIWGTAIEVPGLAALNAGKQAVVNAFSCGSAGSCAAGGFYTDKGGGYQGFVAAERNGVWGKAIEVPGLAALNGGGDADIFSVSCGSAGSCVAGGKYRSGGSEQLQGFVAAERNGVWGTAIEVPGLAALHKRGGDATVLAVSCASAGNCAAGGSYHYSRHHQGFVAVERNGVWGKAIAVPGLAALNTGGQAIVNSVSCASAGNCAAGGQYAGPYAEHHVTYQGFVAVEKNGRWGRAIEVPGLAALNKRGVADVYSVSCGAAGDCAAGGYYTDQHIHDQGFVAVERHGRWGRAIEVPGLAALNTGGFAGVNSVSCASAGNCAVGGDYGARNGAQGFVAVERNGHWGTAIEVLGPAAGNAGDGAAVSAVSCPKAGACTAGGSYEERHQKDASQGFVVSQTQRPYTDRSWET